MIYLIMGVVFVRAKGQKGGLKCGFCEGKEINLAFKNR